MKTQVIKLAVVCSAIFAATSVEAGSFNLGKAVRTAQNINRVVNNVNRGGGQPQDKILPYPGNGGNPGFGGGSKTLPVYPPVYCQPVPQPYPQPGPGYGHKPVCKPPVNRPPVKCYTMKLINNAGAEVYYSLNKSGDYESMPMNDVDVIKNHTPKSHLISYHNGQEVVEYELDVNGTYSFEWQGETLMLLEIQG